MDDISLHPAAEAEYESALAWYRARTAKAAANFEAYVGAAMEFITRFPDAWPWCDRIHRRCAVRRCPYGLIYRQEGELIRVVAVAHDRQLPGFWSGRE